MLSSEEEEMNGVEIPEFSSTEWYEQLFPDVSNVLQEDELELGLDVNASHSSVTSSNCASELDARLESVSDRLEEVSPEKEEVFSDLRVENVNKHDYALKSPDENTKPDLRKCIRVFQISQVTPTEGFNRKVNSCDSEWQGNQHMSKNAIAARENRVKKKKYIQGLEKSVSALTNENRDLKKRMREMETVVESREDELAYLRAVLANVDEISALVKGIRCTTSVRMKTSLGKRPPPPVADESEDANNKPARRGLGKRPRHCDGSGGPDTPPRSVGDSKEDRPGVCLHVGNGQVSLEFCHRCSTAANQG